MLVNIASCRWWSLPACENGYLLSLFLILYSQPLHCRHHPVVKSIPAFCLSTSPFMVCKKTGSNVRNPMILRAQFPNLQAIPSLKSPKHSPKFFPIILKIPPNNFPTIPPHFTQTFPKDFPQKSRNKCPCQVPGVVWSHGPALPLPPPWHLKSQKGCTWRSPWCLGTISGWWWLEHEFYDFSYWECHNPNWRTHFIFSYIGNVIIPTGELIFFRGVGLNHQPSPQNMARHMIWY